MRGTELRRLLAELCEILNGSDHLAGVGVLVVIPRNNLNLIQIVGNLSNHSLSCIEKRTESHADNIGGDDGILVVAEGLGSGSLHGGVDAFLGHVAALNNSGEEGGGAGRYGNSLSGADKLAVELGDNKADSLSSAGRVGNDVGSACTGTSLVALSVGAVEDHLIAGVRGWWT